MSYMLRPKRVALLALGCWMSGTHAIDAQQARLVVRGVVFDSLRGRPLKNASVSIAGGQFMSNTDDRGRFQFDSVPPGPQVVTAHHALLDSIGLPGLSARAVLADGDAEVNLGVPSFSSLWRAACGARRAPNDSSIVYGTIRDAETSRAIAGATIEISWPDYRLTEQKRIVERRWHLETESNRQGGYALCGVPADVSLRLRATTESSGSTSIDLPTGGTRVQRRDFLLSPVDPRNRGRVRGTITDHLDAPVADAVVSVDSATQTRSDSAGRFELPGVAAGTRQLKVLSIGADPSNIVVDVLPGEATNVDVHIRPVYMLNGMTSTSARGARVSAAEFDIRRKSGFGYMQDSTTIGKYDQFVNVLRGIPGLNIQQRPTQLGITVANGKGGQCPPDVFIDGARATFNHLLDLFPSEVGGLEVYTHAAHIPARFVPVGIQPQCGAIFVWTKYGFRNR